MQRLPIIGQPPGPSAVEAVQRVAFEAAGIKIEIEHWERRPHQLAESIAALKARGYIGALIAAPHKEKAAGLVGSLSDDAKQSGAVSVAVRDGTRLRGYNADVDGFNAKADSGGFPSQQQFDAARADLVARQESLEAERSALNAQIDHYNELVDQLTALDAYYADLYQGLDSTDPPPPNGP